MYTMSGLAFLYVLLPLCMAAFLLCPPPWRPGAMLILSLGYYLLVQPRYVWILILCISLDWFCLAVMARYRDRPGVRRACVAASLIKNLGLLLVVEVMLQLNTLADRVLGLHIYAISSLSGVLEAYRGQVPYERNPVAFALYCSFFPRLEAGPLIPYQEFAPQLSSPNPTVMEMGRGFGLFVQGAVKVSVLGGGLQGLYDSLRAFPAQEVTVASTWCALFVLALSVYYRLSGCSVMARGIAAMMGLKLPQNFYFPYQSRGVTDFFERFNMTVSAFLRRNVYDVLGGGKNGVAADLFSLMLVGVLFGLWFGLQVNYLLWGAYLAAFVILEKYVYPKLLKELPTLFVRLYGLCVILSSFTIFGGATLGESGTMIARMFSFGSLALYNSRLMHLLSSNWLLLAVSVVFATSTVSLGLQFLARQAPKLAGAVNAVASVFLLAVLTVFSL